MGEDEGESEEMEGVFDGQGDGREVHGGACAEAQSFSYLIMID